MEISRFVMQIFVCNANKGELNMTIHKVRDGYQAQLFLKIFLSVSGNCCMFIVTLQRWLGPKVYVLNIFYSGRNQEWLIKFVPGPNYSIKINQS